MKQDPVKYRSLVNQFLTEWVEKTKDMAIQIVDSAQNFTLWLDERGYQIVKEKKRKLKKVGFKIPTKPTTNMEFKNQEEFPMPEEEGENIDEKIPVEEEFPQEGDDDADVDMPVEEEG